MKRRKRMLEELDQGIRDHIARETHDDIDRGMPPEDAALRVTGWATGAACESNLRARGGIVLRIGLWQSLAIRTDQRLLMRGCLSVLNGTVPTECHCYRIRTRCAFQMNKFA